VATYSIVIPTVDREREFKATLSTVLAEDFQDLEVLIQSNGTEWDIESYLEEIGDPRLRFQRTDRRVLMHENWRYGIDSCTGRYISVLGDDDGWYAGSLAKVSKLFMDNPNCDAITWRRDNYGWPEAVPCIRNRFIFSADARVDWIDSEETLRRILNGELGHEHIPKIYSSFFHRRVLDRFEKEFKTYFLDPANPDLSTGLGALSLNCRIMRSELPLSVIGTSASSNGATGARVGSLIPEIAPERELSDLWALMVNAPLGILNCYLRVRRLLDLSSYNVAFDQWLKDYVLHLECDHRITAEKIISKSFVRLISPSTLSEIRAINLRNQEIPSPLQVRPSAEEVVLYKNGRLKGNLYLEKLDMESIDKIISWHLKFRSLLGFS